MTTFFEDNDDLQAKLIRGANKLADNVSSTMGPRGRTVLIHPKGAAPFMTKDGVTVAKYVNLQDKFENAASLIMRQAAEETASVAGDGTTTSIVLARSLFVNCQRLLRAGGVTLTDMRKGVQDALEEVLGELKDLSTPVITAEQLRDIATISANNDEKIGSLVAEAFDLVGKEGSITIRESRNPKTTLETVEGFRMRAGVAAGVFVTEERTGTMRYENPLILVTDSIVSEVKTILPALELAGRENLPLIIMADEVKGEALAALVTNAVRGSLKVAALKAPSFGSTRAALMEDFALAVGGKYFCSMKGHDLSGIKLADFGRAQLVESTKHSTTVMGGASDVSKLSQRIELLRKEIEENDDLAECEELQERMTRLASGIAVIHVGGSTEVEIVETKHRIEDSLEAVKSAQEEGILPGSGTALVLAANKVSKPSGNRSYNLGYEALLNACSSPINQLSTNAGINPATAVERVCKKPGYGFDFSNGNWCELVPSGIVDPLKVTRTALQNAVSVSLQLTSADYAIVED